MIQKPLQKNVPLYQQAYEVIKKNILTGKIKPGTRLSENVLAEQLQISRTPLREAISQLKNDGLVIVDNGITKVKELNKKDYEGLYDCRIILEKRAVELVTFQIADEGIKKLERLLDEAEHSFRKGDYMETLMKNNEFHNILTNVQSNRWLVQFLNQIRSLLLLYRANSLLVSDHNVDIFQEHQMILEAIKKRDANAAVEWTESHLLNDLKRGMKMFDP